MSRENLILSAGMVLVVLIAAFMFLNNNRQVEGVQRIAPAQYQQQFSTANRPHLLLDVRTPQEFASGHIPGAVNISLQTLQSRLSEIPRDQPIVVYCRSGNRSVTASEILAQAGYTDLYDLGGIIAWSAQGLPVR